MSEPSTDSETPEAATGYKFVACEDRTHHTFSSPQKVCVDAYKDGSSVAIISANGKDVVIELSDTAELEKQRNAPCRDLAARDARVAELDAKLKQFEEDASRIYESDTAEMVRGNEINAKLVARVKELEAERDKQKIRGDNHAETLRGIAAMDDDPARMRLWARDSLSGQFETLEATLLRLCDERNALTAERDALDDAKQKMWVTITAAENAKQAGDVIIGRLMAERDEMERNRAAHAREAAHEKQVSTELREVVEQLRKDGERLDWLEANAIKSGNRHSLVECREFGGTMKFKYVNVDGPIPVPIMQDTIRDAIDSAMLSQGEEQG